MHNSSGLAADGRSAASESHAQAGAPPALPFAHLNLRRNPFGEFQPAQRAVLAVAEVDRFVRRLGQPGYAVQFIGDQGRGKTTHLLAIMRHFPQAVYVHVGQGQRPPIPQGQPLLIDEIQRLPPRRRRRVYARRVPLAIGTHEDVGCELIRAGFEVDTVVPAEALSPRRLRRILNRRIAWVRRGLGPIPQIRIATAEQLIERFGDNVRAIESYLYDLFQELPGIRDV
jgi:GTPase SAR1 family protein